jgi:hypothetical protein
MKTFPGVVLSAEASRASEIHAEFSPPEIEAAR